MINCVSTFFCTFLILNCPFYGLASKEGQEGGIVIFANAAGQNIGNGRRITRPKDRMSKHRIIVI
jgi:hypothetical protein